MKIKRWFIGLFLLAVAGYFATYAHLYFNRDQQGERFVSTTLPTNYRYSFKEDFKELNFKSVNGGTLNSLLFKARNSKGIVCFWKGNGGTLNNWGAIAPQFLRLDYDVIITDYRKHGKSKGPITLENFYADAQTVYSALKKKYPENRIVIAGFSLGGRIAARLAADNQPLLTLLLDPASTTGDFSDRFLEALFRPFPSVNKFLFQNDLDLMKARSPVVLIATNNKNSLSHQLKSVLKAKDSFFEIRGATHETILGHQETANILAKLLR